MAYEVVLATWNGAEFLGEQLASILRQTVPPVRILVADDGSVDETLDVIRYWQTLANVPIQIVPGKLHRCGSCRRFEELLEASSAPYVMLSDQDDIWDCDKAERLLLEMARIEAVWGAGVPLLVHSDLRLIDRRGLPLAASFYQWQGLNPHRGDWLSVALQNIVTGCTTLVNRACIREALPFPPEAVMHDWWLAVVAARQGAMAYLSTPTVSYRQHGANQVGASGVRRQIFRRLQEAILYLRYGSLPRDWLVPALNQMRACEKRFTSDSQRLNPLILQLWSRSPLHRIMAARALRLQKHDWWRTAGFYMALVLLQPEKQSLL